MPSPDLGLSHRTPSGRCGRHIRAPGRGSDPLPPVGDGLSAPMMRTQFGCLRRSQARSPNSAASVRQCRRRWRGHSPVCGGAKRWPFDPRSASGERGAPGLRSSLLPAGVRGRADFRNNLDARSIDLSPTLAVLDGRGFFVCCRRHRRGGSLHIVPTRSGLRLALLRRGGGSAAWSSLGARRGRADA